VAYSFYSINKYGYFDEFTVTDHSSIYDVKYAIARIPSDLPRSTIIGAIRYNISYLSSVTHALRQLCSPSYALLVQSFNVKLKWNILTVDVCCATVTDEVDLAT
jgi:hypothetical protein